MLQPENGTFQQGDRSFRYRLMEIRVTLAATIPQRDIGFPLVISFLHDTIALQQENVAVPGRLCNE
ncbi:hypothetical protein J0A78_12925 [Providencia rettgeri]|uniref:hypothetical protein n=1 Tax=Providencia rettgeri TaxID=587 RepID=UPI0019D41C38|nr:hypothetical protein [Providencia rettgeri]MBN7843630.1 hypothetical protein [Providencia rettgeri]MBN7855318.1 hypothetical protein [Providencia rettgeri]MBN7863280.1 hypothetical protein [Providencia rettgeri]MBN7872552.1 hypothetical protein [Providencia rettgeri]MBN7897553.1 hypothetical protein [Providencia rettgeri]